MAEDSLDAWGLGYADEDSQHGTRAWRGSHESAQREESRNKDLNRTLKIDRDTQHAVADLHRTRDSKDAESDRGTGSREGKYIREEQRGNGEGERRKISTASASRGDSQRSDDNSTRMGQKVRDDRCDRKSGGDGRAEEAAHTGERRGHGTDGLRRRDGGQAETKCVASLHERRTNHHGEHRSSSTAQRGDEQEVESKNGMRTDRQDRDSHWSIERVREGRSGGSRDGRERGRSVPREARSSESSNNKSRAADTQGRDGRRASASRGRSEAIRDDTERERHTGHERQGREGEMEARWRESDSREKGAEMEARSVEVEARRERDCSGRDIESRRRAENTERDKEVHRESESSGKNMEPRREDECRGSDIKTRCELGRGLGSARGVTAVADAGGERRVQGTDAVGRSCKDGERAKHEPSIASSRAADKMRENPNGGMRDDNVGEKRIDESRGTHNIRQERGHGERKPCTEQRPQASGACERRGPPTVDAAASDVTLDFTHELFDAEKALRTPGLKPPYPDV